MKKYIIALALVLTVLALPHYTFAQTVSTPVDQATLDAEIADIKSHLIALLEQEIAVLQTQLTSIQAQTTDLQSKQTAQASDIKNIKTAVDTLSTPAPVVNTPAPAPAPIPEPVLTLTSITNASSTDQTDAGTMHGLYTVRLQVTAGGEDVSIPENGAIWSIGGAPWDPAGTQAASLTSTAPDQNGSFAITASTTQTFTLQVHLAPPQNSGGQYNVHVTGLSYSTASGGSHTYALDVETDTIALVSK